MVYTSVCSSSASRLRGAPQGCAADQLVRTVPSHRGPLRETGDQPPRHGHAWHDQVLADMALQEHSRTPPYAPTDSLSVDAFSLIGCLKS